MCWPRYSCRSPTQSPSLWMRRCLCRNLRRRRLRRQHWSRCPGWSLGACSRSLRLHRRFLPARLRHRPLSSRLERRPLNRHPVCCQPMALQPLSSRSERRPLNRHPVWCQPAALHPRENRPTMTAPRAVDRPGRPVSTGPGGLVSRKHCPGRPCRTKHRQVESAPEAPIVGMRRRPKGRSTLRCHAPANARGACR
jgi:hypothetical protein